MADDDFELETEPAPDESRRVIEKKGTRIVFEGGDPDTEETAPKKRTGKSIDRKFRVMMAANIVAGMCDNEKLEDGVLVDRAFKLTDMILRKGL